MRSAARPQSASPRCDTHTLYSLTCPTLSANDACSNVGCILPRPDEPRSPPRCALEQSEYLLASASKARCVSSCAPPPSVRICSRKAARSCASGAGVQGKQRARERGRERERAARRSAPAEQKSVRKRTGATPRARQPMRRRSHIPEAAGASWEREAAAVQHTRSLSRCTLCASSLVRCVISLPSGSRHDAGRRLPCGGCHRLQVEWCDA